MFEPKNEELILDMYRFAYPGYKDLSLIQLIDLEFPDFLTRMATLKKAADNGFEPEMMQILRTKLNATASEMWSMAMAHEEVPE